MNPIAKMLIDMAKFYDQSLDDRQLEMYVRVLEKFPQDVVMQAGRDYVEDFKNVRFPIPPHKILEKQLAAPDSRDVANEMARMIDKAVSKYGYMWADGISSVEGKYWEGAGSRWPSFKDAVIAELGDIGWHVICSRGGWLNVRNSSNEMDEGQFIAQMRDQIQSTIRLKESGHDVASIALPGSKQSSPILGLVKIKQIDGGEDV